MERLTIITSFPTIEIGRSVLTDIDRALSYEWIVTNGLGGYASSTVLGINTRKYHGLLVASFDPPNRRFVVLSKLEEEIKFASNHQKKGEHYSLSLNEFKDGIYPSSSLGYIVGFSFNLFPTFYYEIEGVYITKKIVMPLLKNAIIVVYTVLNTLNTPIEFRVKPLVNMRHIYQVTDNNVKPLHFTQKTGDNFFTIKEKGQPFSLLISSSAGKYRSYDHEGKWINRIFFRVDQMRGESHEDDNFQPGEFRLVIEPEYLENFFIIVTSGLNEKEVLLEKNKIEDCGVNKIINNEKQRKIRLINRFMKHLERKSLLTDKLWFLEGLKWLVASTEKFLVHKKKDNYLTAIAGYHWFGEWGRDALISLPGLTLVIGRFEEAKEILLNFSRYCKRGLIPNCFPEISCTKNAEPSYNSVDTSLWFINAAFKYFMYTRDLELIQKIWNTLHSIIEEYIKGTLFDIKMDKDCLIKHGPRLTWMDATVDGGPVTPRGGKAVEVEALWYNSLRIMSYFSLLFGFREEADKYSELAEKAYKSFNETFWYHRGGYLYDVIGDFADSSLRPNQILALSLNFPIVNLEKGRRVVETIWRNLWGVYGLRTLDRNDSRYEGKYMGDWNHRDKAYHNGTVWTWLLGPFITAFLKVKRYERKWRLFALERFLKPLIVEEPFRAGLGSFSEIFDGDPPHSPQGCISQSWSVAEPLRAVLEDILYLRPSFEKSISGQADKISASL